MQSRFSLEESPSTYYRAFDDARPDSATLLRIEAHVADSDLIAHALTLADVAVDLAMTPGQDPVARLATIGTCIERTEDRLASANKEKARRQAVSTLADLMFRAADAPNWLAAASGTPLTYDYNEMLTTTERVLELAQAYPDPDGNTLAKIREYIPLILGARAMEQEGVRGWFGRTSLTREDKGEGRPSDANWDTGLCPTPDPATFDTPPIRLQVKTSLRGGAKAREAFGIATVLADRAGFAEVDRILAGCRQELGQQPLVAARPFPPGHLDATTTYIINRWKIEHRRLFANRPGVERTDSHRRRR